jgi:hypothetical protein
MTAGRGVAHSEESPAEHDPSLHGVQLWVALPDASRHTEPTFAYHAELPAAGLGGVEATVFAGSLGGARSPARMFSEIVGAELAAHRDASGSIPLAASHEHVILWPPGRPGWTGRRTPPCCGPGGCCTWTPGASRWACPRARGAGCSCSAASRSASRFSCGGTWSRAPRGDRGARGRLAGGPLRHGPRLRRRAADGPADGCAPATPWAITRRPGPLTSLDSYDPEPGPRRPPKSSRRPGQPPAFANLGRK